MAGPALQPAACRSDGEKKEDKGEKKEEDKAREACVRGVSVCTGVVCAVCVRG